MRVSSVRIKNNIIFLAKRRKKQKKDKYIQSQAID